MTNGETPSGHALEARLVARALKDEEFGRRLRTDPKSAISEHLQIDLPADVEVTVVEDPADGMTIVIPYFSPDVIDQLSEDELAVEIQVHCVGAYGLILGTCTNTGTLWMNK